MPVSTHRTVPLTESVPAPTLPRAARLALTSLVLTHALLASVVVLVTALGTAGHDATLADAVVEIVVIALLMACGVVEAMLAQSAPFGAWALDRAGLGVPARMALRGVLVAVVVTAAEPGAAIETVMVLAAVGTSLIAVVAAGLAQLLRRVRQLPVVARGLDLPVTLPTSPGGWVGRAGRWPVDVLVFAAVVVAADAVLRSGSVSAGLVVFLIAVVLSASAPALAACAALTRAVLATRRVDAGAMTHAIEAAVDRVEPEIALYYAGPADAVYQVAMWLPTFERLADGASPRRTVVVVRSPEALAAMPPTSMPVVCVERGNALLALRLPASLRVACYVSNASGNIHLLRDRALRHVFIGHGDSDKTVSTGRYAKVYDEIWEAGPAGRQRWLRADVGVADADVVEVGAPFLAGPRRAPAPTSARPTIAYAPTWEGVADDADATSLGQCGEALVARLLADGVRVIYRPHPLAGTRDRRVARAHVRVLAMLGLGERDGAVPTRSAGAGADQAAGHVYAPAERCTLGDVLAAADAAVTDVSAALSQVVAAGMPVAVPAATGSGSPRPPAFVPGSVSATEPVPTAVSVAYPVGPDGTGVEALVAAVGGDDPLAAARAQMRSWLFGVDPVDGRFAAAVEAAIARPLPARPGHESGPVDGG